MKKLLHHLLHLKLLELELLELELLELELPPQATKAIIMTRARTRERMRFFITVRSFLIQKICRGRGDTGENAEGTA